MSGPNDYEKVHLQNSGVEMMNIASISEVINCINPNSVLLKGKKINKLSE